jgi:hypothetical protein
MAAHYDFTPQGTDQVGDSGTEQLFTTPPESWQLVD